MSYVKLTPRRNYNYLCPKCLTHRGMKAGGSSAYAYFVCNTCETAMECEPMTKIQIQERSDRITERKARRRQPRADLN